MAYADQKMSGSRVVALIIVALIHVALGYAFVTGLAYQYIKKATEELKTFEVDEPPPPPEEEPPPPPPEEAPQPPPVVSPPPIVRNPNPPPAPIINTVPLPPPVIAPPPPRPAPPPPPPPPPPPRVSQAARVSGNPGRYFGPDAYPPSALREGASGRVSARLTVGTDGRVSDCTVTSSSGNQALDDATCRISRSRVRFTAAKDENGAPTTSTYPLNVRWELPDN